MAASSSMSSNLSVHSVSHHVLSLEGDKVTEKSSPRKEQGAQNISEKSKEQRAKSKEQRAQSTVLGAESKNCGPWQ